jgi:hypothetical protein
MLVFRVFLDMNQNAPMNLVNDFVRYQSPIPFGTETV